MTAADSPDWTQSSADEIMADIHRMIWLLKQQGVPAQTIVVSPSLNSLLERAASPPLLPIVITSPRNRHERRAVHRQDRMRAS